MKIKSNDMSYKEMFSANQQHLRPSFIAAKMQLLTNIYLDHKAKYTNLKQNQPPKLGRLQYITRNRQSSSHNCIKILSEVLPQNN